jgi:hypothetical protein
VAVEEYVIIPDSATLAAKATFGRQQEHTRAARNKSPAVLIELESFRRFIIVVDSTVESSVGML